MTYYVIACVRCKFKCLRPKFTVLYYCLDIPGGLLCPPAALLEAAGPSVAAAAERRLHRHVLPGKGDPLVVLGHRRRTAATLADGDLGLQGDVIVDFPLVKIARNPFNCVCNFK